MKKLNFNKMLRIYGPLMLLFCTLTVLACKKKDIIEKPKTETVPETIDGILVPFGGNAFIQTKAAAETIEKTGLTGWTSDKTISVVYFRVQQAGELKLGLKLKVAGGTSQFNVTANGVTNKVTASNSELKNVYVGKINVAKEGYVKVEIQGISKTGSSFAEISDLVVGGTTAANLIFANDPENYYWSRRGPSVHLGYTLPASTNAEWFYNELTVPVGEDSPGSYFMANGFGQGYFGIQSRANDRWVLFSVWDPSTGITEATSQGQGVTVQRFGGEGTGGQSYVVYNWKAGVTYKFLTQAKPDGAGNTLYSAWFFEPEANSWRFMCTWKRPLTDTYLTGLHSFLENFYDYNGYMGRKMLTNNQWICTNDGVWIELKAAKLTGDATVTNKQRMDYAGGIDNGTFYLKNGGFFDQYIPVNQNFTRTTNGIKPEINFNNLPKK
ncbi:DUF5077 domain-containing protein [Pedobacter aquatilis]|uniref:DUF3472 domain-containing protein n=1 Tax=Pedobacter aquatilis TaxID=351343 RepID=UPI0025B2A37F|nr:DUF5077 domain-containing protein [Pedobacter aquatilis]MDN3585070.1 DUF5077 domain-containing protein [Pedobacter aquatilis]